MKINDILALNVRRFREEKDWSQHDLAIQTKLSAGYLAQIELGQKFPSAETLTALTTAFGIRPYQLFMEKQKEFKNTQIIKLALRIASLSADGEK